MKVTVFAVPGISINNPKVQYIPKYIYLNMYGRLPAWSTDLCFLDFRILFFFVDENNLLKLVIDLYFGNYQYFLDYSMFLVYNVDMLVGWLVGGWFNNVDMG